MTKHLLCLTIDTDPDGLNTYNVDRGNLSWKGLDCAIQTFHDALPEIPLTWYVRADGQLETAYGSVRYLLETYADFWESALQHGDELGWHPHLYYLPAGQSELAIITDSEQACDELQRIHRQLRGIPFDLLSFRMGEAWHTADTLNLLEKLGYRVDSTAIPNRDDSASGHPRNWAGAPNQPYYPDSHDIRRAGSQRALIEIPMNSWLFQASYDQTPKLRYMNPCIHADLWEQALDRWEANLLVAESAPVWIWNLILHPAEAMPHDKPDMLYAYSVEVMRENLESLKRRIQRLGHEASYTTVYRAAQAWIRASMP